MQRRSFLIACPSFILATSVAAQEKPKPEIVDTHTHFYDPTRPQGAPWPRRNHNANPIPFPKTRANKKGFTPV